MVILSASILTRGGKVVIARQFVEMSRIRIEGLLAAFPKLLGSDDGAKRQHTFIDTESVRYVFQPIEHFLLLLITNKTSNIVEDLQTIQLLSKLIPDVCGHITDDTVRDKQFELVFAFDEAITAGGHSENISSQQIQTNLEMESHEEKLHNMILQSKRAAAKDEMKRQQSRIRDEQRQKLRADRMPGASSSMSGIGSQNASSLSSSSSGYTLERSTTSTYAPSSVTPPPAAAKATGMKLGGKKKGSNFMDAMVAEDDLRELPPMSTSVAEVAPPPSVPVSYDPIVATVEEKISALFDREGTLEQCELKGSLFVSSNNPATGCARLKLRYSSANDISFQTHPKANKTLFERESILGLKDETKPFPESKVGVLRWSVKTTDTSFLPISITCWPEDEGNGKINVNLEYNLEKPISLQNVNILIPLGTADMPEVISIDGEYHHNSRENSLLWHHDVMDSKSNSSGSLEFNIGHSHPDSFFPISISFHSSDTYADIEIDSVQTVQGDPVKFGFSKLLTVEKYAVH